MDAWRKKRGEELKQAYYAKHPEEKEVKEIPEELKKEVEKKLKEIWKDKVDSEEVKEKTKQEKIEEARKQVEAAKAEKKLQEDRKEIRESLLKEIKNK